MMNGLKRVLGGKSADRSITVKAVTADTFKGRERTVEVVGESAYQDNLALIAGPKTEDGKNEWVQAQLVPEAWNKHDRNAVSVRIADMVVGYLSREGAVGYHAAMTAAGYPGYAVIGFKARIQGGWRRMEGRRVVNEGHYGVKLYLPEELGKQIGLMNG